MGIKKKGKKKHKKKHTKKIVEKEDCVVLDTRDHISELPRDVLMKILVSVGSIKTIVRCRCVCKSWLDLLFGDPYFARLHFSRVKAAAADCIALDIPVRQHKTVRHSALLDFQDQDDGSRPFYEIPAALVKLFSLKYTDYIHESSTTKLLGSCNGLLCFYHDTAYTIFSHTDIKPMFVSNPLTREYVVLPIRRSSRPFEYLHGFGFSRKTNQCKVIQLYSKYSKILEDGSKTPIIWKAKVHTLGSGVWRSIGIVPYNFSDTKLFDTYYKPGTPNTYLNGTLYWVANYCSSTYPESFKFRYINILICSFDLESEQFQSLPPLPNEICQKRFHSLTLGVLGDRLCIVCDATILGSCSPLDAEIWVLNDKSNDSGSRWWVKEHVIKVVVPNARPFKCYYLKLIKVLKTGEILFFYGNNSIFYNPRDESSSRVKWIRTGDMVAHTPSFVSLKDVASGNNWEVINAPFKLQSEVEKGLMTVNEPHALHKIEWYDGGTRYFTL